ncbi:3-hydroxyacyl-thioester dehydratase HtdZ [Virgisporangium ochraceum]|uniref:Putative enoyl-CoA hydratase 1 n=1 Tax=Virgisporangium ochraceum TaxID=65505 RepID=A0A8J4EEV9_9ACTN|nr:MaoC family dehydratase [Virgisporangium ochraceum]GIJ73015.1 putative enoyl-CoA hydratase 1 [Virgisporangium ochraceum]
MRSTTVPTPTGLLDLVGTDLGTSGTHVVTQEQINLFADVTGDHQWIHVDAARAADGPFGTTIAHGFLTLALVPGLLAEILVVERSSMGVNYGLDRVRFVRPLPPGVPVRGSATLMEAKPIEGGVQAKAAVTVEFAETGTTCCVAEVLFRYYT